MNSTREQILIRFELSLVDPSLKRISGLFRYLELNRTMRFLLHDNGP
jgi:hypothetical protein